MSRGSERQATDAPVVSIGLPVYNGAEFVAEAIESILKQTFSDFELIISDNASTDDTEAICRGFVALDERIRYQRNASNIGGSRNANATVALARGRFFRWAAHDDILEPELLERCVEVLDASDEIALCYTQVTELKVEDGSSTVVSRRSADSPHAAVRFGRLILSHNALEEIYGLMRLDVLRTTRLLGDYTNSDRVLIAEISLHGAFREIAEPLFIKRFHVKNMYLDWRTRKAWFRPDLKGSIAFPWWAQWYDLVTTITRVKVPASTRAQCFVAIGLWTVRRAPNLAKDVASAVHMGLRGRQWRMRRYAATHNWE